MIVDAAFTSIGLNYFTAVVPKVMKFREEFIDCGKVKILRSLSDLPEEKVENIWKNRRSWQVVRYVASYLCELGKMENLDDQGTLRLWATNSNLESWRQDPIGRIKGVGLITFQYLRMMGGIDTAMPDKMVRRVIRQILNETRLDMSIEGDTELVRSIQKIAGLSSCRPVEICWMTWLIQPEGNVMRTEKYQNLLDKI